MSVRAHAGRPDSNKNFQLPPKIKRPNLHIVRYTCQCEQYQLLTQNERRAHPNWAPTREPKRELLEILFKVLRLTSEQVQDLNDWMKHRGIPNVHEIIVQNFCNPHELKNDLQFTRDDQSCYIQSNVMVSLSLMTIYIKHLRYLAKAKHFGPFYYIQIDPKDYDEWRIEPPEEEIHFQTPSKL